MQCDACGGTGRVECELCRGKGKVGGFLGLGGSQCSICEGQKKVACPACSEPGLDAPVATPAPSAPTPETSAKAAASAHPDGAPFIFMLIASGNPTVISAYYDLFNPNNIGPDNPVGMAILNCGLYEGQSEVLEKKASVAKSESMSFEGTKRSRDEEPVATMAEVLDELAYEGMRGLHAVFAIALKEFKEPLIAVFEGIRDDAVMQGIMPYPLYITENHHHAQFLLDCLSERRTAKPGLRPADVYEDS